MFVVINVIMNVAGTIIITTMIVYSVSCHASSDTFCDSDWG